MHFLFIYQRSIWNPKDRKVWWCSILLCLLKLPTSSLQGLHWECLHTWSAQHGSNGSHHDNSRNYVFTSLTIWSFHLLSVRAGESVGKFARKYKESIKSLICNTNFCADLQVRVLRIVYFTGDMCSSGACEAWGEFAETKIIRYPPNFKQQRFFVWSWRQCREALQFIVAWAFPCRLRLKHLLVRDTQYH